jgi:hypothetical protein
MASKYISKPVTLAGVAVECHTARSQLGSRLRIESWASLDDMRADLPAAVITEVEVPPDFDLEGAHETLVADAQSWLYHGTIGTTWPLNYDAAAHKAQAWERIKRERSAREYGGFEWDGSRFDSDPESQRRIQGAAQLATLAAAANQPFEIDWTLEDNTVRTLTGAEMIAVGMAMGVHVSTQYAIARGLRAAIEAATTPEGIEAVVWPA